MKKVKIVLPKVKIVLPLSKEQLIISLSLIVFLIKLFQVLVYLLPIGEGDAAHYTEAYLINFNKGANPQSSDFIYQSVLSTTLTRPYGMYGLPAGYLRLFTDEFIFYKPAFLMAGLIIIISLIAYLFYRQISDFNFSNAIVFTLIITSIVLYLTWAWGQWAFLTAMPFVLMTVHYFIKWFKDKKDSDLVYSSIALFTGLQVHQFAMLIALAGLASFLVNELINKRKVFWCFKKTVMFFSVALLAQLISLNSYIELFNSNEFINTAGTGFNLIEAFLMTNGGGYPSWFFNDYLMVYGPMIFLVPFGLIYSYRKKNYFLVLWLLFTFVLSRPSLLPVSHVQLRLAVFMPVIIAMITVNGLKLINNKYLVFLLLLWVLADYTLKPNERLNLSPDFIEVLNWVRLNLDNAVLITSVPMTDTNVWWSCTISRNKFFAPKTINNTLSYSYSDYSGEYLVTHVVTTSDSKLALLKGFVFKINNLVVVKL